ncbi:hypothetical protein EPNKCIFM_00102 [Klebsiella phage KP13-16]|nr:hypothetical protein EPNKCIFM_00102 [Klebsiella phage KP13-16]
MKVEQFGHITFDGKKLKFEYFHFETSYEGEPVTHAGMIKSICEYLNSTIVDDSFKPFVDVLTGEQL